MEKINYGHKPTLFPMTKTNEDRATSIFFAVMGLVYPLRKDLLHSIGLGAYKSGNDFSATLHPSFGGKYSSKNIPDALIHLEQKQVWQALVEVKIKGQDLTINQLDNYLERVKEYKLDALLTISNELCSNPMSPPLRLKSSKKILRKISHFHWSWQFILHRCRKLLKTNVFETDLERQILMQFVEYLHHKDSGVAGFDTMPPSWKRFVSTLRDGVKPAKESCEGIVESWFQETSEIALKLSEKFSDNFEEIISDKTAERRREAQVNQLFDNGDLLASYKLKEHEHPVNIRLDLNGRILRFSCKHDAPTKVSTPYKQIEHFLRVFHSKRDEDQWGGHDDVRLLVHWPRLKQPTQMKLFDAIQRTIDDELKDSALIHPEKDKIKSLEFVYTPSGSSSKIPSNKGVISFLEDNVEYFVDSYVLLK